MDIEETANLLRHLVQKMGFFHAPPSGLRPPVSKRKRDADVETCHLRQLMCIPSISEKIARKLLEEFGSLPALQTALADIENFPRVKLDDRSALGKARLEKLAAYLTSRA